MLPELLPGFLMLKDHDSWVGAHSRRTGYAVHLPSAGVLALIDPPTLSPEECTELEAVGPPTHVLLTCNWHLRGGEEHRRRWGCPILIHEAGLLTAETRIDGTFRTGDRLWGAVQVVQHITEFGWPEVAAFLIALGSAGALRRVLYVGDAICGGRLDVGVPDGDVGQYTLLGRSPEAIRQLIPDVPKARAALERLLDHDFHVLAFGHGAPVTEMPRAALHRFLSHTALWQAAGVISHGGGA